MGVGSGLYMYDVVVKRLRSLSHLLMSSCTTMPECNADARQTVRIIGWANKVLGPLDTKLKPEEASTHKSAKTHAGAVFVHRDLDLWLSTPK